MSGMNGVSSELDFPFGAEPPSWIPHIEKPSREPSKLQHEQIYKMLAVQAIVFECAFVTWY